MGGTGYAAPDIVEDFTNFDAVAVGDPSSPTDTGSLWGVIGGGSTSTSAGFEVDPTSYHGKGVTWSGSETSSIIQNTNFTGTGPTSHQLAFTIQFSAASGSNDNVQAIAAVPSDANLLAQGFVNYVVSVGRKDGSSQGLIVYVPVLGVLGLVKVYAAYTVACTPGEWHKVVIQYKPATTLLATNASLKLWIDPASSGATPNLSIASGIFGSFWGNGKLGKLALGDSTSITLLRPLADGVPAPHEDPAASSNPRVGSSRVKMDTMGAWYGTMEARAGELADAITFFESFTTSNVPDWSMF